MKQHKLRIIHEVKKRPILWVEQLPSYYKTHEKCFKEWEEIGKLIGVDAFKVKRTWQNLRYHYLAEEEKIEKRILKAKLNGNFDPHDKYYTWIYYDDLKFLAYGRKYAKKKEVTSSRCQVQSKNEEYSNNDIEVITINKSNIKVLRTYESKCKCKQKVVNKPPVLLNKQLPFKSILPVEIFEPIEPLEYIDEIPSSDIEIEIEESDESSLDIHESMQDETIDNEDINRLINIHIKKEPQDQEFSEHMFEPQMVIKTENRLISQFSCDKSSLTGTALDEIVGNAETSQCALISLNQEKESFDKENTLKKEDLQIKTESEENFAWGNKYCPEQVFELPIVIKTEVCSQNELISLKSSSIESSLTGIALNETVGNVESNQCALISLNQDNKSTDKDNTLKKEDLQIKMESEENFAWENKHYPEQICAPPTVIKTEKCSQNEQVSQSSPIKNSLTGTNLNETVDNLVSSLCALFSCNQENKSTDKDNILEKEDVQIKIESEENFVWENKHYSEEPLSSNSKDLFIPKEINERKTLSDSTNGKRNNNNKEAEDHQSKENNTSGNNNIKRSYLADDKRSYYDSTYTGDPDYIFLLNCLPPMAIMKKSENTHFRAKVAELVFKIFSSSLPVVNGTSLPL